MVFLEDGKAERICDRCSKRFPNDTGGVLTLDQAQLRGRSPLRWDLCNSCMFHLVLWKGDEIRMAREQAEWNKLNQREEDGS